MYNYQLSNNCSYKTRFKKKTKNNMNNNMTGLLLLTKTKTIKKKSLLK